MKKLTLLLTAAFFIGNAAYAQYIDITDIYFTASPSSTTKLDDSTLTKGDTATLWFTFENNLSGGQGLMAGDSLSFGWSKNGVSAGVITMDSLSANTANGQVVNAYLRTTYELPTTYDSAFTICAWPLYNPYSPNTDPMNGRGCGDFKSEEDPNQSNPTTGIEAVDAQNHALFFVNNHSISYTFQSEHASNRISLIDLTGKEVLNAAAGAEGTIELGQEIPAGFYILKASTATDQLVQKVFVD